MQTITDCCSPAPVRHDGTAAAVAMGFKALGDPVRLRLYALIVARDEACVCELTPAFTQSAATISHHLKVLREAGLVTAERRGTWVHYRAQPDAAARLRAFLG